MAFHTFTSSAVRDVPKAFLAYPSGPDSPVVVRSFVLLFYYGAPDSIEVTATVKESGSTPLFLVITNRELVAAHFTKGSEPRFQATSHAHSTTSFASSSECPAV